MQVNKFESSGKGRNKRSFTVGLAGFLTRTNEDLSGLMEQNFGYNMLSAVKRCENSLERAGKAMVASERKIKQHRDNWYKALDNRDKIRKHTLINTQKYLRCQMDEKVNNELIVETEVYKRAGRK